MTTDDKKVVWILGAGFSRPLGGPLLDDLISGQTLGDLGNWPDFYGDKTPENLDTLHCAEAVLKIYLQGCQQQPSRLWSNAEEFLDRLDWACRDTTNLWSFRIRKLGTEKATTNDLAPRFVDDVKLLRREAMRFVAGACTYFTSNLRNIKRLEMWQPYFRWAGQLKAEDTILTFNYDNVLDQMDPYLSIKLAWVIPKTRAGEAHQTGSARGPKVYHLHGHVGWQDLQSEGRVNHGDPMAHLDPTNAILGTPARARKN